VFITWDAEMKEESFTVQPKFSGNAVDFGMVIPTPAKPKLDEMPRDFFKELAVFTILKRREAPQSRLIGFGGGIGGFGGLGGFGGVAGGFGGGFAGVMPRPRQPDVKVVETGLVGSLDYKIIKAGRADDLFKWLKAHKYHYSGDEATLDFYVKKKWFFTVMKIDTMQMKKNKDGTYTGEVTPTRFQFESDQLIYPLKITQLSVKERTEALFYVQTSYKVDLPGDMTYQFQWIPMLQNARGWYAKGTFGNKDLPGKCGDWLEAAREETPQLLERAEKLGFSFQSGVRPTANKKSRIPTTLEWAKRLTSSDIKVLKAEAPYSEVLPNVDFGFTRQDVLDRTWGQAVVRTINNRLEFYKKRRPGGFLVRKAPKKDVKQLKLLLGHLQEGQYLTKFRKTFTKGEMNDDLLIVPARLGKAKDRSEYEEILPTSPP
jgi:hypothetical protein